MPRFLRWTLPPAVGFSLALFTLVLFSDRGAVPSDPEPDVRSEPELASNPPGGWEEAPQDLGLPEGPFDPVLAVPADVSFRMPAPSNRLVNDPILEETGVTQSEVSIAVNGDKIVVGWNDGQGFVDGSNLTGVAYSTDRGDSWTDQGDLEGEAGLQIYGDPTIAALSGDRWVTVSLNRGNSNGLAVNLADFSGSVPVWEDAYAYEDEDGLLDKEYLAYDPSIDRLYMSYGNFGPGISGRLAYSDDGGETWPASLIVDEAFANGYYPAVAPDGGVYVSWVEPVFQDDADLFCRYSSDGGVSWAGPRRLITTLGPSSGDAPQCFNRGSNINWPSMAVDQSTGPNRGRVYAVYPDGAAGTYDCFLRYSDDQGQTWSEEILLNDNENPSEQFWPQVTTGPDGRVSVGWYDRRKASNDNSLCDFYVTQSVDGGVTWGPNRRMSDTSVAWCGVPSNLTPNFGDYIECVSDDRSVFAVWADGREGDPDVFFGRIDDYQTVATNGDFGGAGPFSADAVAYLIPNEAILEVSPSPIQSPAEVSFVSTVFGLLSTPQETAGIFDIGGEALSGSLLFDSDFGSMEGSFTLARTGPHDLDLDFDIASDLAEPEGLLPEYTMDLQLLGDGPGSVVVDGIVSFSRFGFPPVEWVVTGAVSLDGAPGASLQTTHMLTQENSFAEDPALIVHSRTRVDDGVVVSIPEVTLGTNPPPLAVVRQAPNPWAPGAEIRFQITHDMEELAVRVYSPQGRLLRTIAQGAYAAGEHAFPFDGRNEEGADLPNGGYFLVLEGAAVRAAGKLIVVR